MGWRGKLSDNEAYFIIIKSVFIEALKPFELCEDRLIEMNDSWVFLSDLT